MRRPPPGTPAGPALQRRTDEQGERPKAGIPFGSTRQTCPVRGLRAWREAACDDCIEWRDYSTVDASSRGRFRYLAVEVGAH
jgi:hypothetical protein